MVLVDAGKDFESIRQSVLALNNKMPDKLDESEILMTVMTTVMKEISKRP